MSKIVVVSPHLDDGVFSTGDMLASESNATVVTLFSGMPGQDGVTDYDKMTGFESSYEAMRSRIDEDIQATAALGVAFKHLPFYDSQYKQVNSYAKMKKELANVLYDADVIYFPVGMRHSDHEQARNLVVDYMLQHPNKDYYAYEELPYRIIEPNLAKEIIDDLSEIYGFDFELMNPRKVSSKKILAVHRYKSQMDTGEITPYTVLAPERHWRVIRYEND